MSTYTKTTNFTAKDNLTSGDPAKVIKGSEFDTEFNAIETAVNSKADKNNGVHTGTTTIATANIDTLQIDGVAVTSTSAELNKLDGFTGDVTDLNKLASVTATATEINVLDGSTATTADLNKLAGVTATSTELNLLDGVTATTAELNFVDGVTSNVQTQLNAKQPLDAQLTDIAGLTPADGTFIVGNGTNFVAESGDTAIASLGVTATATELNTLDGITATTAELNITDGLTATTAELNVLDGITATTTELNYTDGVTSNIQTQLNTKAPIASPTFTGTTTIPTVDINGGTIDGVSITGTTASFSGEISANGGIALGDNDKATFGASDDLQIFHDGSNSFIKDTGDGILFVQGSGGVRVLGSDTSENLARFNENSSVQLYYDNSEKLATTATGVDVTGTVTADGLTVDGDILLDSSTQAFLKLDRGSAESHYALTRYYTGGTEEWRTGTYNDASSNFYVSTPSGKYLSLTSGGDFHLYEDTGTTAKFVWDASAESLGIGTSSPSAKLTIQTDGDEGIRLYRTGTNANFGGIEFRNSDDTATNGRLGWNANELRVEGTDKISFTTSGSERARIDSSGNFLVGTTQVRLTEFGQTSSGINLLGQSGQEGQIQAQTSGTPVLIASRRSSDGDIIQLRKDGSTVGSIGSVLSSGLSTLAINTTYDKIDIDGQLAFEGSSWTSNPKLKPINDNAVNLGDTANRFKDLYLSGGVYLGGTDAVNKLDDYEEGVWTPTIGGTTIAGTGTYAFQNGSYVKVGKLVTINAYFRVSSHTGTGSISITNLPYVVASGSNQYSAINVGECVNLSKSADTFLTGYTIPNSSEILLRQISTGSTTSVSNIPMDTGFDILISCTYQTT